jgi:hypothetical protein
MLSFATIQAFNLKASLQAFTASFVAGRFTASNPVNCLFYAH